VKWGVSYLLSSDNVTKESFPGSLKVTWVDRKDTSITRGWCSFSRAAKSATSAERAPREQSAFVTDCPGAGQERAGPTGCHERDTPCGAYRKEKGRAGSIASEAEALSRLGLCIFPEGGGAAF